MISRKILYAALIGLFGAMILGTAQLGAQGSNTQFATPIEVQVGNEKLKLVLTGTAMRKKLLVNVYSIGSYVQEGVGVRTAEELAAVDSVKRLHLVMERDVSGKDMAEAFRSAIRQNYAEPQFTNEIAAIMEVLQANVARRGDHVWLTHVPGTGLQIQHVGKTETLIKSPTFARAVWDIYLGKNNLGEAVKKSLVSRL